MTNNNKKLKVAALILNWNKIICVISLLSDLLAYYKYYIDIFIVDNGSTDESVNVLKSYGDAISLIQNEKNLGGAGGFNTGLEHIMSLDKYDYVWILDNDVEISKNCLENLLTVINSDPDIGIVGSRIVDIANRKYTVETGGKIGKNLFSTYPLNRNTACKRFLNKVIDVDYVAICSALVKTEAIKKVGVLDPRFFLFWDDMEWGFRFKSKGFKVVCSTDSVVYHNSFTERDRGYLTLFYYGIRNPLLFQSIHLPFFKRIKSLFINIRLITQNIYLLELINRTVAAKFSRQAISDFLEGKWGNYFDHNTIIPEQNKLFEKCQIIEKKDLKQYEFLFPIELISYSDVQKVITIFNEKFPNSRITLLGKNYRKEYFKNFSYISIMQQKMSSIISDFNLFFKLFRRFDAVISNQSTVYSILARSFFLYHDDDNNIYRKESVSMIKFAASYLISQIVAIIVWARVLIKSFAYRKGL